MITALFRECDSCNAAPTDDVVVAAAADNDVGTLYRPKVERIAVIGVAEVVEAATTCLLLQW